MKPLYSSIWCKALNLTNSKVLNGAVSELGVPETQEGRWLCHLAYLFIFFLVSELLPEKPWENIFAKYIRLSNGTSGHSLGWLYVKYTAIDTIVNLEQWRVNIISARDCPNTAFYASMKTWVQIPSSHIKGQVWHKDTTNPNDVECGDRKMAPACWPVSAGDPILGPVSERKRQKWDVLLWPPHVPPHICIYDIQHPNLRTS